jgi:hypothetical protein
MDTLDLINVSEGSEAENTAPEVTPAPAPKVEDNDEKFLSKFQQLSLKEKQLLKQEQELKSSREKYSEYQQLQELAKTNPAKILEHFGLSYKELADYLIGEQEAKNVDPAVAAIKAELDQIKKEKAERELQIKAQQEEQAIGSFKSYISTKVKEMGAELIMADDKEEMVYDACYEYYAKYKKELPVEKAIEKVEAYLQKQAEKYLNTNKFKSKLQIQQEQAKEQPKENLKQWESSSSKFSLNNNMGTDMAQDKPLSKEERLARAASFLK